MRSGKKLIGFEFSKCCRRRLEICKMNLWESSFGIGRDLVGVYQTFYKLKGASKTQLRTINGHSVKEHVVIEKGQ